MNKKYYREFIRRLINQDPTEITITRKITTDDGFSGKIEEEITLEPQTVRIYNKKSQREIISDASITIASKMLKLLTMHDTDIQEGDTFAHDGKTIRVTFINGYFGICKQAELEVIG